MISKQTLICRYEFGIVLNCIFIKGDLWRNMHMGKIGILYLKRILNDVFCCSLKCVVYLIFQL